MDNQYIFKAYDGDKGYIFVSYNHDDEEVVFDIISDFHERGYRIWYDAGGISVGDYFMEELAHRIKDCEIFLCFLSPRYIDSPYCKRELNYALHNEKRIVPIKTEAFKLPEAFAFQLTGITWTNLTNFSSREKMVDYLCDINQKSLKPCYEGEQEESQKEQEQPEKPKLSGGKKPSAEQMAAENLEPADKPKLSGGKKATKEQIPAEDQEPVEEPKPPGTPVPPVEPIPPGKPKWLKYLPYIVIGALAIIALILALTVFSNKGEKPDPAVQPTSAPVETPVQTEAGKPEEAKPAAAQAATPTPLPTVKPEDLASSAQRAVKYLSKRAEEGCPISVYDPAGTEAEEADYLYDNAVAALALLADNSKNKNHSDSDIKLILDSIAALTNEGTIFTEKTGTGSLAAASIALMQYDKAKVSFSYAHAAQMILDRILETCSNAAGGFSRNSASGSRSTADNIWLQIAFRMLADKTGDSRYADAARSAEKVVLSMRSSDGTFYLAGDDANAEFLSTDLQALAAIAMNDRTGIGRASELCGNDGGFPPDNKTADGFSTESTLFMALAFRSLGMEDEAAQALSAVYRYQLDNGSIPGADTASFSDGQGRTYRNLPKTSAAAWYVLAAAGYNPF